MSTIPRPAYSVSVQQEAADRAAARRRHLHERAGKLFVFALLILGTIITTLPFAWLVSTSLKSQAQIFTYPPEWIPDPVLWRNYREALTAFPFGQYVRNTLIISGFNMVGTLLTASLAAYAFARLRFPGRDVLFMMLLSTLMLPYAVIMIPRYIEFRELGWLDSWLPLIVPNWFGGSGLLSSFCFASFSAPSRVISPMRPRSTAPASSGSTGRSSCPSPVRPWWSSPSSPSSRTGTTSSVPLIYLHVAGEVHRCAWVSPHSRESSRRNGPISWPRRP